MKKITLANVLIFIFILASGLSYSQNKKSPGPTAFGKKINTENINPENGYVRCVTTEYEKFLQQNNPKRKTDSEFEAWLAPLLEEYKTLQTVSSQSGGIITIPVVVHVIHSGQAVGTAPNITDAQVESQITVLNNDYRRLAGTPGFNTNPVGADIQIQFALAKVDPNGNPTNGINRVNLCQASWSTAGINSTVKPQTIWDPTQYLNMWSVNFSDATLLGYAQFPDASGLPGLNPSGGSANTDGVVSNFSTFGSIDYNDGTFLLAAPYNRGRTMTHEVGHWLGLRHIWGDGGCNVDDFCADTPVAGTANFGCEIGANSCPEAGLDMVENYMDYSDDTCMNIFTVNQKDRITVIMNNAARRSSLKTSTKDLPIALFANDAEIKLEPICTATGGSCETTPPPTKKVTIYNRGTSVLTSVSLNYSINGGATSSYTWIGNLASNKFATFDMPVTATASGTIAINIINANGVADQRASNNSVSGEFQMPTAPSNFAYTTVNFTIQPDYYGPETTWTLKNGSGTTLYSGGPYPYGQDDGTQITGLPAIVNQTWNLPINGCYTFTINDTEGDGICCSYGQGFYNVKSTDGTVTLISGGQFGSTESKSFTNNALGNEEFATSNNIYVYPNPAKTNLNIAIPNELGLPNSYILYNYLGQIVGQKEITSQNDLSIDTSSLSNGVYLITITKDNQKKTLRFIKN